MLTEFVKKQDLKELQSVKDKELNSLLQEINSKRDIKKIIIQEVNLKRTSIFKKKETGYLVYSLLGKIEDFNEVQCMSLCNATPQSLTKKELLSFFYGLLN